LAKRLNPEEERQQRLESKKTKIQDLVHKSAVFQRFFSGGDSDFVLSCLETVASIGSTTPGGFNPDPYWHAYVQGKYEMLRFIESMKDEKKAKKQLEILKELENAGRPDDN